MDDDNPSDPASPPTHSGSRPDGEGLTGGTMEGQPETKNAGGNGQRDGDGPPSLWDEMSGDVRRAFDADILEGAYELRELQPAEFQVFRTRLKAAFKASRWTIGSWDEALHNHCRSMARAGASRFKRRAAPTDFSSRGLHFGAPTGGGAESNKRIADTTSSPIPREPTSPGLDHYQDSAVPGGCGDHPHRKNSDDYEMEPGAIWAIERDSEGNLARRRIAYFSAIITADFVEVDGGDETHSFEIETIVGTGAPQRARISAERFNAMGWPTVHFGAQAAIAPSQKAREMVRLAIQLLSPPVPPRRVYHSLGWHRANGDWVYVHADGVIGGRGEIDVPEVLRRYRLSAPPSKEDVRTALRSCVELLTTEPLHVMAPLFAAPWRAKIGGSRVTVVLRGEPTLGKTLLATLAVQSDGADFSERSLPATFKSTSKAINQLRGKAGDVIFVVDDFVVHGTHEDLAAISKFDEITRTQFSGTGVSRLSRDARIQDEPPVNGILVITAEALPPGHSLRTRAIVLHLTARIDRDLAPYKDAASSGRLVGVMHDFVSFLAPQLDQVRRAIASFKKTWEKRFYALVADERTSEQLADLAVGVDLLLSLALERGAISEAEAASARGAAERGFDTCAREQVQLQQAENCIHRFFDCLRSALAAGRCHLLRFDDGTRPDPPDAWGWQATGTAKEWRPGGDRIGYLKGKGELLLDRDAAFAVARRFGADTGAPLAVTPAELTDRLHAHGLLLRDEMLTRRTKTVRVAVDGVIRGGFLSIDPCVLGIDRTSTASPRTDSIDGDAGVEGSDARTDDDRPGPVRPN